MKRNQVAGAVKDKAGKTQQKASKAAGSSDWHAKGVTKQSDPKMQNASENVKAAFRNSRHS